MLVLLGAQAVAVATRLPDMQLGGDFLFAERGEELDAALAGDTIIGGVREEERREVFIDHSSVLGQELEIVVAEVGRVDQHREVRAARERIGFVLALVEGFPV